MAWTTRLRTFWMRAYLYFIQLRSIAERFREAFQQYAWDCNHGGLLVGHGKMEMIPQVPPHPGHRVRKRGAGFAIPRGAAHTGRSLVDQQMRGQRYDRVEAHQ